MNELRYQMDLLKAMNQKLSAKEHMYHMMCDTADSAMLYYSFRSNEVTESGRWNEFFDFNITEVRELTKLLEIVEESAQPSLTETLYPERRGLDTAVIECAQKDRKKWYRFRVNVQKGANDELADKVIRISDITKLKQQNEELSYFAYYDSITGLYNRNYFIRLLNEYILKAQKKHDIVSVLMIDIDDFHKINDGMGMVIGDEVVQKVGSFLESILGENTILCHLDSDVYCIALYAPAGENSITHIYQAIRKRTKEPFLLSNGEEVTLTVSVGVAEFPEAAASALELINCAEIVMYKCKALGKNGILYYDSSTLQEFLQSLEIENKLKEAIAHDDFVLYYQPQFYAGTKRLRGMEALIRMRDAEKLVSPATFIPIAEKNGIIIPIGRWVLEESVRQYAKWREQYGVHLILSINISAKQFAKENFSDVMLKTIRKYHVDFSEVEIEITESILIDDFDSVFNKLKFLREQGIRISLDDFGTGFSSLSYLKKLPIDTLKIDKSFIDTVLTDSATRVITESIVEMVKSLGFESIAEGVEDQNQYEYLKDIGCDVVQGYLLGKPLPAQEMEMIIKKMV